MAQGFSPPLASAVPLAILRPGVGVWPTMPSSLRFLLITLCLGLFGTAAVLWLGSQPPAQVEIVKTVPNDRLNPK